MFLSHQEPGLSPGQQCSAGDNKRVAKGFCAVPEACAMWGTLSNEATFWFWDTSLQPGVKTALSHERRARMYVRMHQISLLGLHCHPMQGFHAKYVCVLGVPAVVLLKTGERRDSFRAGPTPVFLEPQMCPTEHPHHH